MQLNYNGTQRGSIQTDGTVIAFNTGSDYRLKENEVALTDGITKVKQQFCSGCGNILFQPLSIPDRIIEIISERGILSDYSVCESAISELLQMHNNERSILFDLKEWATTKNSARKKHFFEIYSKTPGNSLYLGHARWLHNWKKSFAEQLQAGNELKLENLILAEFADQTYEALIKKLKQIIKGLPQPEELNLTI